jgi:hypothetical protein
VGRDFLGEDGRKVLGGLIEKYFEECFERIGDFSFGFRICRRRRFSNRGIVRRSYGSLPRILLRQ